MRLTLKRNRLVVVMNVLHIDPSLWLYIEIHMHLALYTHTLDVLEMVKLNA
jgi:hypothetical protein